MLKTVFTINLNEKIQPGQVAIGKFDGINPCLVAATINDKVLLHNPLRRAQQISDRRWNQPSAGTDIIFLNINQSIKSLTAGRLKPDSESDVLVLGTPTSILVYDVINNVDIFYREIPDGANAVVVGHIGSIEVPLAIAGGNCAIQGFDWAGNDCYWTVTGDNITTLALSDIDNDLTNELIVGSEDYDIRIFKEESILLEMSETDSVKCICSLSGDCFAYALINGTVGVYSTKERLWRIKSKNQPVCLFGFDLTGNGVPELITGWSSGKIDARNIETGEVVFKDNLNSSVACITASDYNLDGAIELIVVSVTGEVKGYLPNMMSDRPTPVNDYSYEQETIRELMKRKQSLALELRNYESNISLDANSVQGKPSNEDDKYGAIPADTQLKSALILNIEDPKPSVELTLQTTNDTVIRMIVIFAEGIFKGESHVVHPTEAEVSGILNVPLRPPKDVPIDLHIKSMVGYKGSFHFHVFELSRHLPRFSMYAMIKPSAISESNKPKGWVTFHLSERAHRIGLWLNRNFLLVEEFDYIENLNVTFTSLRAINKLLTLEMDGKTGTFTVRTDSMEIAGEIVQSLAIEYLSLPDLASSADFPGEIEQLKKLINKVEEIQSVRAQIGADIAENSASVRALVVRSEDSRLLGEWKTVKQLYMDLNMLNRELIHEYQIRSQNHKDLVDSLRQINVIIQKAANLRVGPSKTKVIQLCRLAIKDNNLNSLTRIITTGEA